MVQIVLPAIEAYASAHSTPEPPYLAALAEETRRALGNRSGMMVGQLEGGFLQTLVAMKEPRHILEIGMFTGYSALSMAAALTRRGHITTCEIEEEHAAIARRHIHASPYADCIDIRMGPALDTVRSLSGPFDMVFIDADKTNYVNYYDAVLPKLAAGGVIVADNVLWSGQVLDQGDESADTKAIRRFNDHVRGDPRVVCTMVTVRDGVMLIRRAGPS
jgi:caffeoyl-CoA O-methyltransferase